MCVRKQLSTQTSSKDTGCSAAVSYIYLYISEKSIDHARLAVAVITVAGHYYKELCFPGRLIVRDKTSGGGAVYHIFGQFLFMPPPPPGSKFRDSKKTKPWHSYCTAGLRL
jgi:hypothetical protein